MKRMFMTALLPLILSCGKAGTTGDIYLHMLTGECLNSTELTYTIPDGKGQQVYGNFFSFGFRFDANSQIEETSPRSWLHKVKPSDEIFDNFGTNKKIVKNEYEAIYETFQTYFPIHLA